MNDENRDEEAAELAVSDSQLLAPRSTSLVKRGLQYLADRKQKRFLKVDDEEALVEVTVKILRAEGYEVRSTVHPSEAVTLVTEFQPDVALIDLVMPKNDGFKLSEQLSKSFPPLKIVLTGVWIRDHGIEEEIHRLLDMGIICDTLEAPFEREDLIHVARNWVNGLYHVDPATHLRDAKQFQMEVSRQRWQGESTACVFIKLLKSEPQQIVDREYRELSPAFIQQLSATLRWFAWHGRAYRCEFNKFAVLLPGVSKQEAGKKSADLSSKLGSVLQTHELNDRFSFAIDVVTASAVIVDGHNL